MVSPTGRRLISSGSSFERVAGYSRAVVDGDRVHVSGTTGFDYATMTIDHYDPADSQVHVGARPPAPVNPADDLQPTPQVVLQDYRRDS